MATTEHPRPLLTVPQAAERMNLSTTTVRRRIWEGEIPAVRLGSGPLAPVRVDPDELDYYVYGVPPAASLDGRDVAASVPPTEVG